MSAKTWLAEGIEPSALRLMGWFLYAIAAICLATTILDVAIVLMGGDWAGNTFDSAMNAAGFAYFAAVHFTLAETREKR